MKAYKIIFIKIIPFSVTTGNGLKEKKKLFFRNYERRMCKVIHM